MCLLDSVEWDAVEFPKIATPQVLANATTQFLGAYCIVDIPCQFPGAYCLEDIPCQFPARIYKAINFLDGALCAPLRL